MKTMHRDAKVHHSEYMANMIRELLQARDGQLYIYMSPCEVRTLLEYVCTM